MNINISRWTDGHRYTQKINQTDGHRYTQKINQTGLKKCSKTGRQPDSKTDHADRQMNREMNRQTDEQTDRRTDKALHLQCAGVDGDNTSPEENEERGEGRMEQKDEIYDRINTRH